MPELGLEAVFSPASASNALRLRWAIRIVLHASLYDQMVGGIGFFAFLPAP